MSALPWVLLGKRSAFQPDLDTSAALLTMGKSPQLPSQLLGDPGPPLTTLETKALLEELYKMSARPALPTSSVSLPLDTTHTEMATHVYVKVDNPKGLSAKFEGPHRIVSRPSPSQIEVRLGSYVNGSPRLQTFNWQSCKIAHMRENAVEVPRPKLGRPKKNSAGSKKTVVEEEEPEPYPSWSPRPGPMNCNYGPIITEEMLDQWGNIPESSPEPSDPASSRPVRSTRNKNPQYIDAISDMDHMWETCGCGCGSLWSPAELAAINASSA